MKNMYKQRFNVSGGSSGGGGYDYQAKAYVLIAAKMLAESPLNNWGDTGCNQIPVSISMEVGDGGDDLRVDLASGKQLDIQAKKGAKRGTILWEALLQIASKISTSSSTYGVFLTDTNASSSIRQLKKSIERIGQGRTDHLPDIAEDFISRLKKNNFDVILICSRLRIVFRDFESSSSGEAETLDTLRPLLVEPSQTVLAYSELFRDGMNLITIRGRRKSGHIISLLRQAGINFSTFTENPLIVRQNFFDWLRETHKSISIPSLQISIPLTEAWISLRLMDSTPADDKPQNLEQQLEKYHEWHRLAENIRDFEVLSIQAAIYSNQHIVIIGGPGSGKSTLLRRLTQIFVDEEKLVLRVSLRLVSRRMLRGETFNEAIIAIATQDYGVNSEQLKNMLQQAKYLLADGLDESDPNRQIIATNLLNWASANPERHVIVTTRPIGHNPSWFSGWQHYELLPLRNEDIEKYANSLFAAAGVKDTESSTKDFLHRLKSSLAASLAARNPQLLGFLVTLFHGEKPIDGNRYQLFEAMIRQIAELTRSDREFQHLFDRATAYRIVDHLGWQLTNYPALEYNEIVSQIATRVSEESSLSLFESNRLIEKEIQFWEERGLLERVGTTLDTTITFIHMAFQEFAATRYVAQLSEKEFVDWFKTNRHIAKYREVILLLGATSRLETTISILLDLDHPNDPASVEALLANDILAEANNPSPDLRQKVFEKLILRLTSEIPLVAYEAGEKLMPLTAINPKVTGELGLQLTHRESFWAREIGCALGVVSGRDYVNLPVLLEVYPRASCFPSLGERRSTYNDLTFVLIVEGGKELIAQGHLDVVKQRYANGEGMSGRAMELLEGVLLENVSEEALRQLYPDWYTDDSIIERIQTTEEASNRAFFEAILNASTQVITIDNPEYVLPSYDPDISTILTLYGILDIANSPAGDYFKLRSRALEGSVTEVIRLIMLACDIEPLQARADAEYGLSLLDDGEDLFLSLLGTSEKFIPRPELNWSQITNTEQSFDLLNDALDHPTGFIRRFAVLFLVNCFEFTEVKGKLFYQLLNTENDDVLRLNSHLIAELWPDEAAEFILHRLETNLTSNCHLLLSLLIQTIQEIQHSRIERIFQNWLKAEDLKVGESVLKAIEELKMEEIFKEDIREICFSWLRTSNETIFSSIGDYLKFLCRIQAISFDELCAFAKIKDYSVREAVVNEICAFVVNEIEPITSVLNAVVTDTLPPSCLSRLSVICSNLCHSHQDFFIELATTKNHPAQQESIRALGSGWAERSAVEPVLRKLTRSDSDTVRNIATRQLRRVVMSTA